MVELAVLLIIAAPVLLLCIVIIALAAIYTIDRITAALHAAWLAKGASK